MPSNLNPFPRPPHREPHPDYPAKLSTIGKIRLVLSVKHQLEQLKTMTSWKSKLAGALVALIPVLHAALPDNLKWIEGAVTTLSGLFIMGGRDNNVTSEQVRSASK